MQIPGLHNIENALAAIAAVKLEGVGDDAIREVLRTFSGVKHRIQYLETIDGRRVYNDSKATNVEAATVALNAFDQPIVWLAGGLDRGLPMDALTPLVKKHVKSMVVFGQTAPLMAKIAKDAGVPVQTTENVMTAVPLAYEVSRPGDVILLSPAAASWDQYPNFEVRGDDFIKAVNQLKATVESGDK